MTDSEQSHGDKVAQRTGVGFYPEFHALWHLKELGVLEDLTTFRSPAWEAAESNSPIRIVVLDTPVDWEHPNLKGVISTSEMRDFSSKNTGSEIPADMTRESPAPGPTVYGAHGTAVAGLIGARPATPLLEMPYRADARDGEPEARLKTVHLPYIGINPFCQIIPVSMSAAPDPDMVGAALEYIGRLDPPAHIVVVAAAWDDATRATSDKQSFDEKEGKWSDVEAKLRALCDVSIVLCAAGNSGPGEMAYPACLAGQIDRLIAVTACDPEGNVLTYAFDPKDRPGVIRTLSSQGTRYDRDGEMLDPWVAVDPYLKRPAGSADFPVRRIISLDPRGPLGYNPSAYRYTPPTDGPHLEIASLYAEFSGSSASTAIAAGLISLALQSGKHKNANALKTDLLPTGKRLFGLDQALGLLGSTG